MVDLPRRNCGHYSWDAVVGLVELRRLAHFGLAVHLPLSMRITQLTHAEADVVLCGCKKNVT